MFKPLPITLQCGALHPEPLVEAGIPELVNLAEASREALQYMDGPTWPDRYRQNLAEQRESKALPLVVRPGMQLVGTTRFAEFLPALPVCEIGWTWLDQAQHSSDLNHMAKYLMLKHAFGNLHMVRVQLSTTAGSLRAQGVVNELSAQREGVPRNRRRLAGGRLDNTFVYSIIDHEWPQVKTALETNFTDRSRFRRSCGMLGDSSGRVDEETAAPDGTNEEHTHLWHAAGLGGVELLHACHVEQCFAPHVYSSFALVIVEQDAQHFRHRGSERLAPLGGMVLINPDEVHTGSKAHDADWLYRGCYPEMEQIDGILNELEIRHGDMPRFADSVIHNQLLARAFVHLHRLLAEHAGSLETQTRWREAMLALFRRHAHLLEAPKAGQEPLAVAHARELLAARLLDPSSLKELATAVNLPPFHFARVFHYATSMPSHAWLGQCRLGQARILLENNRTLLEVALELGFADQGHLDRQFKQAYGIISGEYHSACAHSSSTTYG